MCCSLEVSANSSQVELVMKRVDFHSIPTPAHMRGFQYLLLKHSVMDSLGKRGKLVPQIRIEVIVPNEAVVCICESDPITHTCGNGRYNPGSFAF
jgi:hypothetical protein